VLPDVTVFKLTLAGATIGIDMSPILLGLLVILAVAIIAVVLRRTNQDRVIAVTVDIPLGGIGRLTFNSDREVARLAHQAWLELMTRKAGLPLDEENDVIEEVLNSWYELFRELRTIAKAVPPPNLRTKNARTLVSTLVRALNDGLRPPLTKWQARFRSWYAEGRKDHPGQDPQTIQRGYPHYDDLMADLRRVNGDLRAFADALHLIAQRAQADAAGSPKESA
jgi:hypothetical protein